jgi:hypothetical protein
MGAASLLVPTLALAAIGSATLVALALVALGRRRSAPYLLVTLALATLFARTAVGWLTASELLVPTTHHLAEHGLDALTAVLLLGAVVLARREVPSA